MKNTIKLFDVSITKSEERAVLKTLKSHFWASGAGINQVQRFEEEFKKYIGSDVCISTNSGTASLQLALCIEDVKKKEIMIPSLTFAATAHAVVHNGATPKFVDVDPDTLCINTDTIQEEISEKTKVILPVHFGGMPCNMKEISKIASKNNLSIIEDAAHAAGASFNKKRIGTHGKFICFSFHPVKNLAMPNGGAITINDKDAKRYEKLLKSLRWCGIVNRNGPLYDIRELGWNYYMNEFSAAIGLEQLKKIDNLNDKRRKIAKRYHTEIKIQEKMAFNEECSYHLYWIRVKNREEFMKKMTQNGIETGIHYIPLHKTTYYRSKKTLPITEKVCKEIVSIPMHANLSKTQVDKIIACTNKYC